MHNMIRCATASTVYQVGNGSVGRDFVLLFSSKQRQYASFCFSKGIIDYVHMMALNPGIVNVIKQVD